MSSTPSLQPSRRQFLHSAAAIGAGLFLSRAVGSAAESAPRWKTAIGLNGFESSGRKYNKTYPIWEILDFAKAESFDGVELVSNWPQGDYPSSAESDRIRALRNLYDNYGLSVFSIQLGAGGAFDPEQGNRRAWVSATKDRLDFARQVGCNCVGMWPGGGLRGQSMDDAITRLAESFRLVAELAAERGLVAAFEIEPPFVFNTEEHLTRIIEKANHPNLKTIYDPSHFDLMNGSSGRPHEMLKRVGVEHIGYVHLTDTDGTLRDGGTSKHLACGDGHANIPESLRFLREGGFSGWIMIDAWEIPDPYDACRKGVRMIRSAMK